MCQSHYPEVVEMGVILGACFYVFLIYIINEDTRKEFTTWCVNTTYTHLAYLLFLAVALALWVSMSSQVECSDLKYTLLAFGGAHCFLMLCVWISWLVDIWEENIF